MTKQEALALAEGIATANYTKNELTGFIEHLQMADTDELNAILDAYYAAINKPQSYQLKVGADFIERLENLKPLEEASIPEALIIPSSKYRRLRFGAAAAVLFAILTSTSYLMLHKKTQKSLVQTNSLKIHEPINDVKAPSANNAVITLSNGKQIILDSAGKGTLAMQGNVNLVKLDDGRIAYTGSNNNGNEVVYNTLTNPKGSKVISLTLSDGSQVWLNAASSVKYPTAFVGKERNVEMTGEAYFEVSKDAAKPFSVSVNGLLVKVLGTHFNINAYSDETSLKTTLMEGSVKLTRNQKTAVLSPGQQALSDRENEIKIIADADMESVLAWKNGYFKFNKTDIETMMRQAARWYDIEVKYSGGITPDRFSGKISRNVNLSQLLKILEYSDVHFTIDGKTVTFRP